MKDNTVDIEFSRKETFRFSQTFNVAVPFIDRHMEEGRGDTVFIRSTSGEVLTFQDLFDNVNKVGNLLLESGLKKGDRLVMVLKDCPEFFYFFWGAIKAGIIPAPVNVLLKAKDYHYFIEDTKCEFLVYSHEFAAEVQPALTLCSRPPERVLEIGASKQFSAEVLTGLSNQLVAAATTASSDCFILYSSGSTGQPKGAVHLHKNMVIVASRMGVQTLNISQADLCFSASKLFFAYGLGASLIFPLWAGCGVVISEAKPKPDKILEILETYKPTLFFGIPTLYAGMIRQLESTKKDLSSVRIFSSAGEALPPELFNRWEELTGQPPLDGIGSTENLNNYICNRPGKAVAGSSGIPVPGYQTKIIDETNHLVNTGEKGQLLIKSDSAAARYWNKPEKTAATFQEGWIITGDTYYQDPQGYYIYCGRNDDMLKVGGIWCSPFEIESKLLEHPDVLEVAVIGAADENQLIKPRAFLVLEKGKTASEELARELRTLCKNGLAAYKYPRWFDVVNDLPKTATGKIQRYKLRSMTNQN